jgi:hypothetical protein
MLELLAHARSVNKFEMARWLRLCTYPVVAFGLACSADHVEAIEPRLTTPGSFVAYEEAPGNYGMFRSLTTLQLEASVTLLATQPYGWFSSYEEAEKYAKRHDIPTTGTPAWIQIEAFDKPYRIVWFRTLTESDRQVLR